MSIQSPFIIKNGLQVAGDDLIVEGGKVGIGTTELVSTLNVDGGIQANSVIATGIVTASNLDINGSADFSGSVTVGAGLNVTGVATFTPQINVTGGVNATSIEGSRLNVTGPSTFATINVTGLSTFKDLNVTGVLTAANIEIQGGDFAGIVTSKGLDVDGDALITGITTIGTGLTTVQIGLGQTTLAVSGDTAITGDTSISGSLTVSETVAVSTSVTVGNNITIDGTTDQINVGSRITIDATNNQISVGNNINNIELDGNTGSITATEYIGDGSKLTGIIGKPVTNVLYVSVDGDDFKNSGRTPLDAKRTIGAALKLAKEGTVVKVAAGNYFENNPVVLPKQVSIVGDSLRDVAISPQNADQDFFYVTQGSYISDMSFTGILNPGKAIISFNPDRPNYISESPYVRNCTNFIHNSVGMRINGRDAVGDIKSMVVDSYTQYNQGGIGVSISNEGYAQLVSIFTICSDTAIICQSGAQCDLTNSNSSFGTFGLVADGVGPQNFIGSVTETSKVDQFQFPISIDAPLLDISNAQYDNAIGIVTITTTAPHNYAEGTSVTIRDLTFSCDSPFPSPYLISNAVYDADSGIVTVTTSQDHNFYVGAAVTMKDLTFTCDSDFPVIPYSISTAVYDNITGVVTVTTSSPHNFYVGSSVTMTGLTFTCDSNYPVIDFDITDAEYDNKTGQLIVTTSTDHNFYVGSSVTMSNLTYTCESEFPVVNFSVIDAPYDKLTGIVTVQTSSDHNFYVGASVTFSNFVYQCDSGGGPSTSFFPSGNNGYVFNVISIPTSDTFIANVGVSTLDHTYVDGGNVSISTFAKFPSGNLGYVFNVSDILSSKKFVTNVGTSTIPHTYVNGGNVSISTFANFPSGNLGFVFNVTDIPTNDTFTATVGASTLPHTYVEGGVVSISTFAKFPSGNNGFVFDVLTVPADNQFSANVGVSTLEHTYVSGGQVGIRPTFDLVNVSNAVYDNTTGKVNVTTSSEHGFYVGASVTMTGLTFTCDSDYPVVNYDVINAPYDNGTGIVTVQTSSDHNFYVGASVTFSNFVYECDSGGGPSTSFFPSGNLGYVFNVLEIPTSDTFIANVGPSTIAHTYIEGGNVSISTFANFPSGNEGFVFKVNDIISSTEFLTTVGVSTLEHTYVKGGTVGISSVAIFPSGNFGNIFTVEDTPSATEFSAFVGISSISHVYEYGGTTELYEARPYDGQVIYFGELYNSVDKVVVTNGGSGYGDNPPVVTIDEPSEPWGIQAKAIAILTNGIVTGIEIISNGRGYTTLPSVTLSAPASGVTATAEIRLLPSYYVIASATPISAGISTVTLTENIPYVVGAGTSTYFFKQSKILASSHSFQYIGSGNEITTALPQRGGVAIQENEIQSINGGLVIYTSTDQAGNFRIGDGVVINQQDGSISGRNYLGSLFANITPYILALGGN